MNKYYRILCLVMAMAICAFALKAEEAEKRPGLVKRIINYFDQSNDDRTDQKPFDVTFIGGPSYSSDLGASIGLMAAGLYKTERGDSLTPVSNVTLFGDVATTGFYMVGVRGNHAAPKDAFRINYNTFFYNFPTYFWGIGYDQERDNANKTKYKLRSVTIDAEFQWHLPHEIYLGPSVTFNYTDALNRRVASVWDGLAHESASYGAGISACYDTRDIITNAHHGTYFALRQDFRPRFIGNKHSFSSTEITVSKYFGVWKDCVMAVMAHGMSCYGDVPWQLLPTVDRSDGMRAYYEGRYRDKNEIDMVVEFRQHVWRRNGIVLWGGLGYVFPNLSYLTLNRSLPAVGVGYRWEFKKSVNVRFDLGFGRGTTQIALGINEAF